MSIPTIGLCIYVNIEYVYVCIYICIHLYAYVSVCMCVGKKAMRLFRTVARWRQAFRGQAKKRSVSRLGPESQVLVRQTIFNML